MENKKLDSEIRALSDDALLAQTRRLVKVETETTTSILHHLREVERRRLFGRHSSLFAYCVEDLGYSRSAAQRRIDAMRLLRDLPEVEAKVQAGKLTLSVVAEAQSFFRREARAEQALAPEQKREVLGRLEGQSFSSAERTLLSLASSPVVATPDRSRPLSETHRELRFVVTEETWQDLEQLRGLLAHSHPDMSLGDLVALLAKRGLEKLDPARQVGCAKSARQASTPASTELVPTSVLKGSLKAEESRVPSVPLRRAVFRRDGSRCAHRDPVTGKRCGSQYRLQIDHILPFGRGGKTTFDNLRVVCRNHNARYAIEAFGLGKMARFMGGGIKSPLRLTP